LNPGQLQLRALGPAAASHGAKQPEKQVFGHFRVSVDG
jgi:hypothetical protein